MTTEKAFFLILGIVIPAEVTVFEIILHGWGFAFMFLVSVRCGIGLWKAMR